MGGARRTRSSVESGKQHLERRGSASETVQHHHDAQADVTHPTKAARSSDSTDTEPAAKDPNSEENTVSDVVVKRKSRRRVMTKRGRNEGSSSADNGDHLCQDDDDGSGIDDVALEVTCGTNTGRLVLNRLETGSRGLCIESPEGVWMTPNEFQSVSGRGNAKDWKRSIRHHEKSLKLLEKLGLLTMYEAPVCLCEHCDSQVIKTIIVTIWMSTVNYLCMASISWMLLKK